MAPPAGQAKGGPAAAHPVCLALPFAGALCINPEVGVQLVGAHPQVAGLDRPQAGPFCQDGEQREDE